MTPRALRLLVMHVSIRCDQACAHCSIWRPGGSAELELNVEERLTILEAARALGARAVLFTGGEPLLSPHIETLVRAANGFGLSVQIATNGLGLGRSTPWLAEAVDEVYVSLEGPEEAHDSIRGSSMFARLRASLGALAALPKRPRLVARSVLTARNTALVEETVAAARALGFDAVSFLPIDAHSGAFGADPAARSALRPGIEAVAELRRAVERLAARRELGNFVMEDAGKLSEMADRLSGASRISPILCNAPQWSSVVEADGSLRPCFFQPAVAGLRGRALGAVRDSRDYALMLQSLGEGNRTCAACVCPKRLPSGVESLLGGAGRALAGVAPTLFSRRGNVA